MAGVSLFDIGVINLLNSESDLLARNRAGKFWALKLKKIDLRITSPILSEIYPDFCGQLFRHELLRNDSKLFLIVKGS